MRVAIVRDTLFTDTGLSVTPADAEQIAEMIAEELHDAGHTTLVCAPDEQLPAVLADFIPERNGCPTGMVFNLVRHTRGEAQRAHVPALLEMRGIPYVGASPFGQTVTLDHAVTRALLRQAGIRTPNHWLMRYPGDAPTGLEFPLLVRPRRAEVAFAPRVVKTLDELDGAVGDVATACDGEAFVEEYIEGFAIRAALLGNDGDMELLPLVDEDQAGRVSADGAHDLSEEQTHTIRELALTAFDVCSCLDYASIKIRIDSRDHPMVVGVDPMPDLALGSWYGIAAALAGYMRPALVEKILDVAHTRYFGVSAPRFDLVRDPVGTYEAGGERL